MLPAVWEAVDLSDLASSLCRASGGAGPLRHFIEGAYQPAGSIYKSADTLAPENGKKFVLGSSIPVGKGCFGRHGQHPCRAENAKGAAWGLRSSGGGAAFLPMMMHCGISVLFAALQSVAGALELRRTEKLWAGLGSVRAFAGHGFLSALWW